MFLFLTGGNNANLCCAFIKGKFDYAVFDMARCTDLNKVSWKFIECLKDGWLLSEKYNSCMRIFNPPKIIMFSNECPPKDVFTHDRYDMYTIQDNKLINY